MTRSRGTHYATLTAISLALTLPSLGAHSLWDMDEGVNAGCAREMLEAGTWVVPTFNWELRSAKPVFLYWLQRLSYQALGVDEFSARLPSVLLGLGTVLATYELARRMFDALVGWLAGVVLASAIQFCVLSHAATPDAPLILFSTLAFYLIWRGSEAGGRGWAAWPAVPCALAVLSKGPIGVAAPGLAVLVWFAWNGEWRRLLEPRLVWGFLILLALVAPWLGLVTAETRGDWLDRFINNENLNRMAVAQEHHSGPPYFYLACLLVLFAPWSSVLGGTVYYAGRAARLSAPPEEARATRFLLAAVLAYLVPFSLVATKLPNYIGPLYPPLAILTAWFLVRWMRGELAAPRWLLWVAVAAVALTGAAFLLGFLILGGAIALPAPVGVRLIPGLEAWAWVGLIPLGAAAVMAWALVKANRPLFVGALAAAAVGLVGVVAAGPVVTVDKLKAAKPLVLESGAHQPGREIRLAAVRYFQDSQSLTFYAERRVEVLTDPAQVLAFLKGPLPSYLFIPEPLWQQQFAGLPSLPPHRVAARHYDLYRHAVIIVVTTDRE